MLIFKRISKEKFKEFTSVNFKLQANYKGAFYPLKSLNQIIYFIYEKDNTPLKKKIFNRKGTYIYETTKNNFHYALIDCKNINQFKSIKKLLKEKGLKNRYNNIFLYNNVLEFINESKRPN